jgi:hypothetical protein
MVSTGLFSASSQFSLPSDKALSEYPLVVLTYSTHALSRLRSDGATNRFPVPTASLFILTAFLLRIADASVSGIRRTDIKVATGSESAILGGKTSQQQPHKGKPNRVLTRQKTARHPNSMLANPAMMGPMRGPTKLIPDLRDRLVSTMPVNIQRKEE